MIREAGVQGPQEVIAVERVILPRILAVERDQDRVVAGIAITLRQLQQLVHKIVSCVVAVPGRVRKADEI